MSGNGAVSGGHRKRWSISGTESGGLRSKNGAEQAENRVSGGHRKRWSVREPGAGGCVAGTERGVSRTVLSVERLFLPLTLRSHALKLSNIDIFVNTVIRIRYRIKFV